jgi:hypothetical protein
MNHSFLFSKQFFETEIEGLEDVIDLILDVEFENLPSAMAYGCPITEGNSVKEPIVSFTQTNQPTLDYYSPVCEKLEAPKTKTMSPLEALLLESQAREEASSFLDCLPITSAPKRSNSGGSKYISFSSGYKKRRSFQKTGVSLPAHLVIAMNESAHCLGRRGQFSITSKVLAAQPRSLPTTSKPTITKSRQALISKHQCSTPLQSISSIQGILTAQKVEIFHPSIHEQRTKQYRLLC